MIQFNKKCEICGRPTSSLIVHNFDGHILCKQHFYMMLDAGLLEEGMDDEWHFIFYDEKRIKELISILK